MLRLKARAKINWSLDILGCREDGYHWMDMLMESVELADELTLEPADKLSLSIIGKNTLSTQDNLVLKAAHALRELGGVQAGAQIALTKNIPIGAGMGGGSADAAATLIGLNRLWDIRLSVEQLSKLALVIGADVPFLLKGGLARVGGIGEEISTLNASPSVPLVIIQPCQALSTKEVFAAYDTLPNIVHPQTNTAVRALCQWDIRLCSRYSGNVLQQAGETKRPQISEAVAALNACNADFAMMTGSGSAVYGAFLSEREALDAYRLLHKRWRKCWLTRTCSESISFFK